MYAVEDLLSALKEERLKLKMSQRELSQRTGIPQGQISNIENNTVDLRVSTLMAMVFALNFDLALIPRSMKPVIKNLLNPSHPDEDQKPLYRLDEEEGDG